MSDAQSIERTPTGINGFDQVALGGLPAGRSTLVTGSTGSGKTVFAVEFLARGVTQFDDPAVFVTFEETPADIRRNSATLGFAIEQWEAADKWAFVDASESIAEEAVVVGTYDFGALAARIDHAVRQVGAKRVSIDSLDAIFTRYPDNSVVRHQLFRLAATLEPLGVTSLLTAERTSEYDGVSRYGVEEFAVDNVVTLRNVLVDGNRRRTVEVVKFRGCPHRTGEWLFTIDPQDGVVVIPLAFLTPREHAATTRVSSGNAELDEMCGGGWYQDAIVLLTGPTGAGKTLTSLQFAAAGAAGGERCLLYSFDENREQLVRNAAGWGIDLDALQTSGLVSVICDYPEVASLEDHFLRVRRAIEEFTPVRLVIDTLSSLERIATPPALLDFVLALAGVLRHYEIIALLTSATAGRTTPTIATEIASLADVTIILRYVEQAGEIARAIAVLQTRGSAHDPSVRRVTIDADGLHISDRWSHVALDPTEPTLTWTASSRQPPR